MYRECTAVIAHGECPHRRWGYGRATYYLNLLSIPITIPRSMLCVTLPRNRRQTCVSIDMTRTGTVAKFRYGVVRCWSLRFLMRARTIIICMTTRAIGLIGRRGPGCCLRIVGMTIAARHPWIVIAGVKRRRMYESQELCPPCSLVTSAAIF